MRTINYADSYEEIKPLVDFCKAGRLFDVQKWISEGKPVNLPCERPRKARWLIPLQIAMEKGFHSLVQVLLEGGAQPEAHGYSALRHAVYERRLDFVELLVENGADIHSVSMETVFSYWKPEIVEFFVSRGADVETDYPLANTLIWRIRPGLGFFKRYQDQFPSLQEQINIALRHHAYEGNLKWVSLLLWAGADPLARGPKDASDEPDSEEDFNALQWAAFRGHAEIFKLKKIQLVLNHSDSPNLLREACYSDSDEILRILLEKGFNPGDLPDSGSDLIGSLLSRMSWNFNRWNDWPLRGRREEKDIDSSSARDKMKMLHSLVRHGVKWKPTDGFEIKSIRRSLLKLTPDYTVELIWVLCGYKATRSEDVEELIKAPQMRTHIANHLPRVKDLIQSVKSASPSDTNVTSGPGGT